MILDYQLIFGMDKQMHFLGYGAISFLLGIIMIFISDNQHVKQNTSLIWFVLVIIGIIEEYRQYMIPNRSAEFLDAIANLMGVTIGLAIPLLISYVIRNRKQTVFKLFALYSIILIPLFLGLVYINERPFLTLGEPLQEKVRNIIAMVGF